jgi:hypothetical protein
MLLSRKRDPFEYRDKIKSYSEETQDSRSGNGNKKKQQKKGDRLLFPENDVYLPRRK